MNSNNERVYKMSFAGVYPHYIQKAEKKGRTKAEVDEVIFWLTGYNAKSLQQHIDQNKLRGFLQSGSKNQSECFKDYRSYLWIQGRRNRRSDYTESSLPG